MSDDSRVPVSPLAGSDARINGYRSLAPWELASEADLMRQVADGSEEALAVLHRRFAPLVFGLAIQTLDRATAEDLVQEVFLGLWRNAARFDPERGTLGAWVRQIAYFRILNELRRQSRQPAIVSDPEGLVLDALPAGDPGPAEAIWRGHCHAVLKSALDELPPLQRQALGLALIDDLTHEQVAAELGLPLGTAKTRIRAGLVKLRGKLGSEWATVCSPASAGSSSSVSGTPRAFPEETNPMQRGHRSQRHVSRLFRHESLDVLVIA